MATTNYSKADRTRAIALVGEYIECLAAGRVLMARSVWQAAEAHTRGASPRKGA